VIEKTVHDVATWLAGTGWSTGIHESIYIQNWIESSHVLFLMVSLGMLLIIDLRMLGWWLTDVPASKVADRIGTPMFIGFGIMVVTGAVLFTANPVRYEHSVWFRIKLILLLVALVNAILFHRELKTSVASWDTAPRAPKRTRAGAAISLSVWVLIVVCGRFIAYDWYDCNKKLGPAMTWATGCDAQ
jgi:hypothetical protein